MARKTVRELVRELQKFPDGTPVMTLGYEGGYHDCPSPRLERVVLDQNEAWYYGPHDDAEEYPEAQHIVCLVLGRA